jgi:hypothetical protein
MDAKDTPADQRWNALMLRAIASKCAKGMADLKDAEVLKRIADQLDAPASQNPAT